MVSNSLTVGNGGVVDLNLTQGNPAIANNLTNISFWIARNSGAAPEFVVRIREDSTTLFYIHLQDGTPLVYEGDAGALSLGDYGGLAPVIVTLYNISYPQGTLNISVNGTEKGGYTFTATELSNNLRFQGGGF